MAIIATGSWLAGWLAEYGGCGGQSKHPVRPAGGRAGRGAVSSSLQPPTHREGLPAKHQNSIAVLVVHSYRDKLKKSSHSIGYYDVWRRPARRQLTIGGLHTRRQLTSCRCAAGQTGRWCVGTSWTDGGRRVHYLSHRPSGWSCAQQRRVGRAGVQRCSSISSGQTDGQMVRRLLVS